MKPFLASLAAGGATLAAFALFLTGAHVDTVTGVSFFYTNASRTGWFYPKDNSYTNVYDVGVAKKIPLIYGDTERITNSVACQWVQVPNIGGSFAPSVFTDSGYQWTPSVVGPTSSVFRCQKPGETNVGYNQTFYFEVLPEPGVGLAFISGMAMLCARRRRSKQSTREVV